MIKTPLQWGVFFHVYIQAIDLIIVLSLYNSLFYTGLNDNDLTDLFYTKSIASNG